MTTRRLSRRSESCNFEKQDMLEKDSQNFKNNNNESFNSLLQKSSSLNSQSKLSPNSYSLLMAPPSASEASWETDKKQEHLTNTSELKKQYFLPPNQNVFDSKNEIENDWFPQQLWNKDKEKRSDDIHDLDNDDDCVHTQPQEPSIVIEADDSNSDSSSNTNGDSDFNHELSEYDSEVRNEYSLSVRNSLDISNTLEPPSYSLLDGTKNETTTLRRWPRIREMVSTGQKFHTIYTTVCNNSGDDDHNDNDDDKDDDDDGGGDNDDDGDNDDENNHDDHNHERVGAGSDDKGHVGRSSSFSSSLELWTSDACRPNQSKPSRSSTSYALGQQKLSRIKFEMNKDIDSSTDSDSNEGIPCSHEASSDTKNVSSHENNILSNTQIQAKGEVFHSSAKNSINLELQNDYRILAKREQPRMSKRSDLAMCDKGSLSNLSKWNKDESLLSALNTLRNNRSRIESKLGPVNDDVFSVLRHNIIDQFMQAHRKMLKSLKRTQSSFLDIIDAWNKLNRRPALLNENERDSVFLNLRDLVKASQALFINLKLIVRDNKGDVLITIFLKALLQQVPLLRLFVLYAKEYDQAFQQLIILRSRPAFEELIELNEHADNLSILDALRSPLIALEEELHALEKLAKHINNANKDLVVQVLKHYVTTESEAKKERELNDSRQRVVAIQERMFGGKVNLVAFHRHCVRYGPLFKINRCGLIQDRKEIVFILLNDILVCADMRGSSSLRLKFVLDLQDIHVASMHGDDVDDGIFVIESSLESLVVEAKSVESRNSWIRHITDSSRRLRFAGVKRRDAMELDKDIRNDAVRVKSTVSQTLEQSQAILSMFHDASAPIDEGIVISTLRRNTTSSLPLLKIQGFSLQPRRSSLLLFTPKLSDDDVHDKLDDDNLSSGKFSLQDETYSSTTDVEDILNEIKSGYLKVKTGKAFKAFRSRFYVISNVDGPRLLSWSHRIECAQSPDKPEHIVELADCVVFASEGASEDNGFDLYSPIAKHSYRFLAADQNQCNEWICALRAFMSEFRVMEGYLSKRGGPQGLKPWKKRYFVLMSDKYNLLYFKTRSDTVGIDWWQNAQGCVHLFGCVSTRKTRMECTELGVECAGEVVSPSTQRKLIISTENSAELSRWMSKISQLITSADTASTQHCA